MRVKIYHSRSVNGVLGIYLQTKVSGIAVYVCVLLCMYTMCESSQIKSILSLSTFHLHTPHCAYRVHTTQTVSAVLVAHERICVQLQSISTQCGGI